MPPVPQGFDSPDPTARLTAIADAGERGDRAAVHELIRQLESTDPGARLLAIRSLQRITGETFGYDYAAPWWERAESVARWQAWARDQGGASAWSGVSAAGE
jgi:hypothetical protein